jgi:hypothetical protein
MFLLKISSPRLDEKFRHVQYFDRFCASLTNLDIFDAFSSDI